MMDSPTPTTNPTIDPKTHTVRLFAQVLGIGMAMASAKIVCALRIGEPLETVPWLIAEDLILSTCVVLLTFGIQRLTRIVVDLLLVYYAINIHLAHLTGGFFSLSMVSYGQQLHLMTDSIWTMIDWFIIAGIPVWMLLHRFLADRISCSLAQWSPSQITYAAGAYVVIALALLGPVNAVDHTLKDTPISTFFKSWLFPLDEEGETGRELSPSPVGVSYEFDPSSAYDSSNQAPPEHHPAEHQKLNVVLLLMESTGNISRVRDDGQTMPTLDTLMQHGVYWPHFYAAVPLSIKTIFSVHTGLDPAANARKITESRPRLPVKTLPEYFKDSGYRTALFHGGYFKYSHKRAFLVDRGYDQLIDAKTVPNADTYESDNWGIDDKAIFDYAESWVSSSDAPFFITFIPILPHHPYRTPTHWTKAFPEQTDLDRYHNCIHYADALLGRFVQFLKDHGRYDDTLFVVVGDHGEAFGQHRSNRIHSAEIYEENVNVPLVISNPRLFSGPQVSEQIASHKDVLPTLCDLLDIDRNDYEGSGLSLLEDTTGRMQFFFTSLREPVLGLRDGPLKFIYRTARDKIELYDLSIDPHEKRNVAGQYVSRLPFYKQKAKDWQQFTINVIAGNQPSLTDQNAIDVTTMPILFHAQEYGELHYNENISGQAFKIAGTLYRCRGFGTHADSILTFDTSAYQGYTFVARFGRDQTARSVRSRLGQVRGQVWLDGQVVFDSGLLKSSDAPVDISVRIEGQQLSLVAFDGHDSRRGDHVNWLEPVLLPPDKLANSGS